MTRHILLAASLFLATSAQADDVPSLADVLEVPTTASASPTDMGAYLRADMSFMDAITMVSTITLPEMSDNPTAVVAPTVRPRTMAPKVSKPVWDAPDAVADAGTTFRPKLP